MKRHGLKSVGIASLSVFAAAPASAHHVMGGRLPSTFAEGFLSGLGHPVIGADHLAFLVAIGLIVGVQRLPLFLPGLFVVAMAVGVWMHAQAISVFAAEAIVGMSVLLVGILIALGRALPIGAWVAVFVIGGLFHGYEFGESIFGAEATPLAAYLLGLAVIQGALTVGIALVARAIGAWSTPQLAPRLVGAAIAGVGLSVLLAQLFPST